MGRPLRVLIIEDSEEDTQLLLWELLRSGYEVEFERVETAEAMQSALKQKTWDLILSDYTLPTFSAPRALEVLKASSLDLPFIIISGTIGEDTAVTALKAGANDFLIKGKFARLGPAIERELREAKTRREHRRAEEALKSSETRYRLAAGATNDVIWEWDSKTNELMWSENAQSVFGYMPEEINAEAAWWDEHIHPEDRERVVTGIYALLESGGTIWADEYRFLRRDGSIAYIDDRAYVERDADGRPLRMIGAMSDNTERKQAEEALAASELRYRMLFESNPHPMWVYDLETLRFLAVNGAAAKHYGYSQDEFLLMTIKDLRPAEDVPVLMTNLRESNQEFQASGTWRHYKKDGTLIDVEIISHSVQWEERPARLVLANDITESKRAEKALRQSEEQYRGLFEDSPISLWVEDFSEVKQRLDELKKNGVQDIPTYLKEHPDFVIESAKQVRILAVNSAAMKVYHARQKSELLGNLADVFHNLPLEQFENELIQVANGRLNFEREEIDHTLTGEKIHVNVRWSVAPGYEDSLAKVIVSTVDITERKQAEETLREKERLLSEAQRIGHIGSWSYDILTDTLIYSDEMYRLFDVSPEEFQHNSEGFLGLIYSSDRPMVAKWMEGIQSGRQTRELEFRILRKNGELRYIRCRGAVEFDTTGKPASFIGTAQDVTERKLSEIQIRQQIERLTALRKIDQAITSSFNLNVTLDILLSQVTSQLQVDAADILLLDPDERTLEYAAGKGFHTQAIERTRLRMDDSQAGRAARERRTIHIESLENKPDERLRTTLGAKEGFVCYMAVPLIVKRKVKGVLEVFHRAPFQPYPDWLEFLDALAGQAAIAIDNATLFENLERSNSELSQAYDATIEGWSRALDLRDKETEGHTRRVTEMTINLAQAFGLPEEEMLHIRRGALLHDIGKMGVPDHILLKPGALTDEEWARMRRHPQNAYDLLKPIVFLAPALDIPYCHHEKWDGTGYPRGLKGEEIPLVARLFAVVDVWDALLSDRPYRKAWTKEKTLEHIKSLSGTHFEPKAVESFLDLEHISNDLMA